MLGGVAAVRIIDAKTAHSQPIGAMIRGVTSAVHEAAHVDPPYGNVVGGDLAEYVLPVHADALTIETVPLDNYDDNANPLRIAGRASSAPAGPAGH